MFEFPDLAVLIVCVAMTAAYFVMMIPKFNLRLSVFLSVSGVFTVVQIILTVTVPSAWAAYGLIQCALYDVGVLTHLLNGNRTVRDVVGTR